MKARELAQGKWRSVLTQLGVPRHALDGKHHACPATGQGEDRFRFADRNGSGNYFCACSDGDKGGMALLMCCRNLSYAEACKEVEGVVGTATADPEKPKRDPRHALNRVRISLTAPSESVRAYLASRGLEPVPAIRQGRLVYWDSGINLGEFDCMVAAIIGPDGKAQSYHVTYLEAGKKASVPSPRKVMPPVGTITGGAIRLCPIAEHMGIAEGIETALSASKLYGVPTWAAVSAHGIETFQPPARCKRITVFADADASFTGQAAAYALAKRLVRTGVECDVMFPDRGDWNDMLRAAA